MPKVVHFREVLHLNDDPLAAVGLGQEVSPVVFVPLVPPVAFAFQ